jgi:hypothetical protein
MSTELPMLEYDFERDGVTQSLIAKFLTCRQSAAYYLKGLTPVMNKEALAFGTVSHWLLEHYYTSNGIAARLPNVANYQVDPRLSESLGAKWEQVKFGAQALFEGYAEYYGEDDTNLNWIKSEVEFAVPFKCPELALNGTRYGAFETVLRGKRDGLYHGKTGSVWLFETKTTTDFEEESKSKQLEIDLQNLFYITATELEFGVKVAGVLYNVLKRPGHRQKQTETVLQFRDRLRDVIAEDPGNYFKRFEIKYSPRVRKLFREELVSILHDFRVWVSGQGATYKNTSACVGRWRCEYLDACASGKLVGYSVRERLYEELDYGREKVGRAPKEKAARKSKPNSKAPGRA